MLKELLRPKPCRLNCPHCYEDWQRQLRENMSTTKIHGDIDKFNDNVINLEEARLALASKEPPSGGNWLSTLDQGVSFLASKKGTFSSALDLFFVGTNPKEIPAVLLGYELNHREGGFKWFDPVKFSQEYNFYMTIKAEVPNDGIAVQEGRVGGDGETKIVDPVHEGK